MATFTVVLTITGLCALIPTAKDPNSITVYVVKAEGENCAGAENPHRATFSYYAHNVDPGKAPLQADPRGAQIVEKEIWNYKEIQLRDKCGELTGGVDTSTGNDLLGGKTKPNLFNRKSMRWVCSAEDLGGKGQVNLDAVAASFIIKKGKFETGGIFRERNGDYLRYEFRQDPESDTLHTLAMASYVKIEIKDVSGYFQFWYDSDHFLELKPRWAGDVVEVAISNLPAHGDMYSESKNQAQVPAETNRKLAEDQYKCNYDFAYFYNFFKKIEQDDYSCLVPCWRSKKESSGDRLCPLIKG